MLGLFLVALSLGASNLAASIGVGLGGVDRRVRVRVAIVFGCFELAMPLIGLTVGRQAVTGLGDGAHQLGGGLLIAVGCYEVLDAARDRAGSTATPSRVGRLALSGFALSIDNLVVGFALGALDVGVAEAVVTIGVVSVAMSLVGLELGRRLGATIGHRATFIGGLVLVAVGVTVGVGIV